MYVDTELVKVNSVYFCYVSEIHCIKTKMHTQIHLVHSSHLNWENVGIIAVIYYCNF